MEYTPKNITSLGEDEVFVFGSNLAGKHAGGAARVARECFGAVMGQGEGMQGQSYAIPTMQGSIETIKPYVDRFIVFARNHPKLKFYVTPIGCGIAGFRPEQIAPLFDAAFDLKNVILPEKFAYVINHARQLASETAGMIFHTIPLKFFDEDLKKAEGMSVDEKNKFFYKLKKEGRYVIAHQSPEAAGNILNTDYKGHHKIAISRNGFAIAADKWLYSKEWSWGLEFNHEILSVIDTDKMKDDHLTTAYGNFAVLLSNGQIYYVWSEIKLEPLFPEKDFIAVESGCNGLVFGLRKNGTLSVAFEENNPVVAAEVRTWKHIIRISASSQHLVGLTAAGTVIIGGNKQYCEEATIWKNINKVYAFDVMPFVQSHNDQIFAIDEEGWLYVTGCPWNNARQYWRKLRAQYDVSDIVSNHDATLVRYTDGSYRLLTPHAMHNFEKDLDFIQRYEGFHFLAARGDTVVIVDKEGEFHIDVDKQECKWWE